MVKGDARQNSVSMNGTFQSKNAVRGSFSVRCVGLVRLFSSEYITKKVRLQVWEFAM